MSSAVHNLQKAILDPNKSLTQLLRETKLIAAKLNLPDVEKWVDLELKGYPPGIEPPEYREFVTETLLMHNPYRRGWQYVDDVQRRLRADQPIAEIEDLSKQKTVSFTPPTNYTIMNSLGNSSSTAWPQRLTVSPNQFKHILEEVRNELLQWAVELEKRGIKGDYMDFNDKEKESASNQVFNIQKFTGVLGSVTNSQVTLYDYSSVQQLLIDHNVPKKARRELEDILDELKDSPPEKKPSLMARGEKWLVEHKELLGAGAEAVGKVIGAAIRHSHKA